MFFNLRTKAKDYSSANFSILSILSLYKKDYEIKQKRYIKARQGCPLKGYCPYDINEPFDCSSCPEK